MERHYWQVALFSGCVVQSSYMEPQAQTEQLPEPQQPAGVPDGTILPTTHPDGTVTHEVIVNDLDADGNVVGWHKETVSG